MLAESKLRRPDEVNNNKCREIVPYDDDGNNDISSKTKQDGLNHRSIKKLTVNVKNCLDVGVENKAEGIQILEAKSEAHSHICGTCGYQFARRAYLVKHQRLKRCFVSFHKRYLEPPHKCSWCSKQYRNAGKLAQHLQIAHLNDQSNNVKEDKILCKDIEVLDSKVYLPGTIEEMNSHVQNNLSGSCFGSRTRRLDYNEGDVERYGCGECNYVSKSRSKVKSHCRHKGHNSHLIYMYVDLPALK